MPDEFHLPAPTGPNIHRVKIDPDSRASVDDARLTHEVRIVVWSDGRLSCQWPEAHKTIAIAMIAEAKRSVAGSHAPDHRKAPPPELAAARATPAPALPPVPSIRGLRPEQILTLKLWANGAMSIEGPVADRAWCLAALANAEDAVRNWQDTKGAHKLIVPARDVEVLPALFPLGSS